MALLLKGTSKRDLKQQSRDSSNLVEDRAFHHNRGYGCFCRQQIDSREEMLGVALKEGGCLSQATRAM
eukprot:5598569-Amphidinium_carterae.1